MSTARQPSSLRGLPAVEKVLQALGSHGLPRPVAVAVIRWELAALRRDKEIPDQETILSRISGALDALRRTRIEAVINGTGIIVHTNLGRVPLAPAAITSLQLIAANYNNLEYSLERGTRGPRALYLEHNLALVCGAEAATVVNNCAAALVLVLHHFISSERPEVIISRGELVEIGGGFRIPEILEASGARLREVGTTNKTSLRDYEKAVGRQTALILKVHRSNFFMGGFVESPATEEIAALARKKRLPFVEDLGSGAVTETSDAVGIEHEPTPAEILKRGVDLVTFSGDKLFGGPQAGLIAGRAKLVAALKREPFFRALRCDKLILSALQTTIDLYLDGQAERTVPALGMLRVSMEELRERAARILGALAGLPCKATVGEGKAQIGGGTLPRSIIPSVTIDLIPDNGSVADCARRLLSGKPPVVGYISGGCYKIDLRTVFPRQDLELTAAIREAFGSVPV
jgi:L-seryl-tRNA(Ser) seleniumtransferase